MTDILIGITGKARSGKGETAKYLQKYHAFHEDSFADPIRHFFIDLLGLKGMEELDEVKTKELPLSVLGNKTLRYAMQTMGTEWGRGMLSDSIWIDTAFERSKRFSRVVISDVRFENEAAALKNRGGYIIKTIRPGVEIAGSSHASEAGIDDKYVDFVINNDACLDSMYSQIEAIMRQLFTLCFVQKKLQ